MSLAYFWERDPGELPPEVWQLDQMSRLLPPGATVYLASSTPIPPRVAAMVSYFLMDNPLVGNFKTAYSHLQSSRPDLDFDYLVVGKGHPAGELDLSPEDEVWSNDIVTLYRRPARWIASIDLAGHDHALRIDEGADMALRLNAGGWAITGDRRQFDGRFREASPAQQAVLRLLTLGESRVSVRAGSQVQEVDVPPGLVSFRTPALGTPATVSVSVPDGSEPAWLVGVQVSRPDGRPEEIAASADSLLAHASVDLSGDTATFDLRFHFEDTRQGYATGAVEAYRRTSGGALEARPAGFWQVAQVKGRGEGHGRFVLDAGSWRCGETAAGQPFSPFADGEYELQVAMYYVNEEVIRWPMALASVHGGRLTSLTRLDPPPYGIVYLPVLRDVVALREALPPDEPVYVPSALNPDYSFIQVATATLQDHTFLTDDPRQLPGGRARRPDENPTLALLPAQQEPEAWGLIAPRKLWSNDEAALYRSAGPAPLVSLATPSGPLPASLEPGVSLTIWAGDGRLSVAGGDNGSGYTTALPEPTGRLQARFLGYTTQAGGLRIEDERGAHEETLDPGVVEYWSPAATAAEGLAFTLSTTGPAVRVLRLEIYRRDAGAASPAGVHTMAKQLWLEAAARPAGSIVTVALPPLPRDEDTIVGVDIYGNRPCEQVHYGYWAAFARDLPPGSREILDLAGQTARFEVPSGDAPAPTSESWPVQDGPFRAFLFLKRGDAFTTRTLFEFTLRRGRVAEFRPYPVAAIVAGP